MPRICSSSWYRDVTSAQHADHQRTSSAVSNKRILAESELQEESAHGHVIGGQSVRPRCIRTRNRNRARPLRSSGWRGPSPKIESFLHLRIARVFLGLAEALEGYQQDAHPPTRVDLRFLPGWVRLGLSRSPVSPGFGRSLRRPSGAVGVSPVMGIALPLDDRRGATDWIRRVSAIDADMVLIDLPPQIGAATAAALILADGIVNLTSYVAFEPKTRIHDVIMPPRGHTSPVAKP